MNKIDQLFSNNPEGLLNIFFTAGYPKLESAPLIAQALENSGVKLIEIGMPYSDPLADGETIQESSQMALKNGMNLDQMFEQVSLISETTDLTIILMGYFNQLMTVGVESFLGRCHNAGVAGLIIPDLPLDIFEKDYKNLFDRYEMAISFLITPRTSTERIIQADKLSSGFLYMVADNSITGGDSSEFSEAQLNYFRRIKAMKLRSNVLIGFGIKSNRQFSITKEYTNGSIIGSEFIRRLPKDGDGLKEVIEDFVSGIYKG